MVGKKSGRALLREEGLERTDNNMGFSSWPHVQMINQKNYYTEFLKRDDQALAVRLQQEERLSARKKAAVDVDRIRAQAEPDSNPFHELDADLDADVSMDDAGVDYGSKTIVIHVGSQYMRLGLATDALPKTVPMVVARRSDKTNAEVGEPKPKRQKLDPNAPANEWFGEEFAAEYDAMASEFKNRRRAQKRRVLPNSRDLVTKWNSTNPPEMVPEHSDPSRTEWTNVSSGPDYVVGEAALRIPENSVPKYRLYWPIQHGTLNEDDYENRNLLDADFFLILEESIKSLLGLTHKKDWNQYSCVFLIPDLYEKVHVGRILDEIIRVLGFQRICFMQESLAATFGAGFSMACIVDMGAQKTSIACVEDGMVIEDSRVNLKFGGFDVTETFIKMMLYDRFNYADINLLRQYDFLLAEELKEKYTTLSSDNVAVQLYDCHLRVAGEVTKKYSFKMYDEGVLAPLGYFRPSIFDNSNKLAGRHKLIPRSVDLYNGRPNDPISRAQLAIVSQSGERLRTAAPGKLPLPIPAHVNGDDATPRSTPPRSPGPDEGTPQPPGEDANGEEGEGKHDLLNAEVLERKVPIAPLHEAIITSINHASGKDERRRRDFLGSIMLTGGASKTPHLGSYLEELLRASMPQFPKEILVAPPPRELDPAVVVWKGGSVFGKLRMTNDSWISPLEYDRLGARILHYKCMWHW
ncbi:actin-related protein, ARP8 class [Piedraia hortae CBS 480.64]|uniref:Actin-related protein, ARP8 class n=1 Tax=Piedraia hortae CBS 480.64 TaxID=1314780 RepID=A0A6A7C029_9PEZI|nr:actin-related protein, ARP8 class [Piedraia hortae CBS 480.64]